MNEEKQNIVLLQSGDERKASRWSFRRYGKGIAYGKWWVLGASVLMAVAGYLGIEFGLNRMRGAVNSSFSYENLALTTSNGSLAYLDGTPFAYPSIVSRESLEAAKASDAKFASINVDSLLDSINITIKAQEDGYSGPTVYVLSSSLSSAGNVSLARSYFSALIEAPNTKAMGIAANQKVSDLIPDNFASLTFEDRISILSEQKSAINKALSSLTNRFPSTAAINKEGTLLEKFASDVKYALMPDGSDVIEGLEDSYRANHWAAFTDATIDKTIAKMEETAEGYIERLRDGVNEITVKQAVLDDFYSSANPVIMNDSSFTATIAEYTRRITDLKTKRVDYLRELEFYGYTVDEFRANPTLQKIDTIVLSSPTGSLNRLKSIKAGTADAATVAWGEGCAAFATKIDTIKELLVGEEGVDKQVNGATHYLYANNYSTVTYYDASVVKVSGTMTPLIGAAAGLVLGFLVSSLVAAGVYIGKIDPTAQAIADKEKEEAK